MASRIYGSRKRRPQDDLYQVTMNSFSEVLTVVYRRHVDGEASRQTYKFIAMILSSDRQQDLSLQTLENQISPRPIITPCQFTNRSSYF